MSDLISRQDAIDKAILVPIAKVMTEDKVIYRKVVFIEDIRSLPSVEPKTGKWIKIPEFCGDDVSGFIDNHFSCSECKKEAEINSWGFYILSDFCPNCGADMRKGGEDK